MTQRYYRDDAGNYLGSYDGPDEGMPDYLAAGIEVPTAPDHAGHKWDEEIGVWRPLDPAVPDSVTARQFRLQLRRADKLDAVKAWVATQDGETQDAFEYSGNFVRNEPMMQNGFAVLGFSQEEVDAFFVAASKL